MQVAIDFLSPLPEIFFGSERKSSSIEILKTLLDKLSRRGVVLFSLLCSTRGGHYMYLKSHTAATGF